jgi:urease accessory protein
MDAPGQGTLELAKVGARTVVASSRARSPLRLLSPRGSSHAQWTFTSTFGGGLVDGDALSLRVRVKERAAALLTTQGTTKIYRGTARSSVEAEVEDGALLAIVGDPITCFAGASFTQSIEVGLAAGASLVLLDALTCGRAARGERWAFARYENRITIRRGNKPILIDPLVLDPRDGSIVDRMRGVDAIATMVLAGPQIEPHARDLVAAIDTERPRFGEVIESASTLGDGAVLVRIASRTIHALARHVRRRLAFVPALLGDDPWARKF